MYAGPGAAHTQAQEAVFAQGREGVRTPLKGGRQLRRRGERGASVRPAVRRPASVTCREGVRGS
jgi:hypothetical protein